VQAEDNLSVEVIDLRSVSPWDKAVLASVQKTASADRVRRQHHGRVRRGSLGDDRGGRLRSTSMAVTRSRARRADRAVLGILEEYVLPNPRRSQRAFASWPLGRSQWFTLTMPESADCNRSTIEKWLKQPGESEIRTDRRINTDW
jgi:hypothetical protein